MGKIKASGVGASAYAGGINQGKIKINNSLYVRCGKNVEEYLIDSSNSIISMSSLNGKHNIEKILFRKKWVVTSGSIPIEKRTELFG